MSTQTAYDAIERTPAVPDGPPWPVMDAGLYQRRKGWLAGLLLRQHASRPPLPPFYQRLLARRRLGRKFAAALVGAALLFASARIPAAHAATIAVDGARCTLVDAIRAANTDSAVGRCRAGSGADVLVLSRNVTLTGAAGVYYNDPTGLPLVTSKITIQGNGRAIRRDPADPDQFRLLTVGATGDLTIDNARLSGGISPDTPGFDRGGAIAIYGGAVAISRSTLTGNSAASGGAVSNYEGTLIISDSTLSGNAAGHGGGVYAAFGSATISRSAITGNTATSDGGGVYIFYNDLDIDHSTVSGNTAANLGGGFSNIGSTLTIRNSTVSGNAAAGRGGGLYNFYFASVTIENSTLSANTAGADGGGAFNYAVASLTINNSTLSGNTAAGSGGGVYNGDLSNPLTIENSTLTGNTAGEAGGGVYNNWQLTLRRSLLSGNAAPAGREVYNKPSAYGGIVNADAFNLFGFSGDAGVVGFTPGPTDIVPAKPLGRILSATLAANGGPTWTHALVPGSPAIDVAPGADCAAPPINGLDQRGFPRNVDGDGLPSGNECDIGAFEFAP